MQPETVTINDIRKAGFCTAGARRWFETQRMDFRAFLKNGVTAEELLATGDELAVRVVNAKREREAHG